MDDYKYMVVLHEKEIRRLKDEVAELLLEVRKLEVQLDRRNEHVAKLTSELYSVKDSLYTLGSNFSKQQDSLIEKINTLTKYEKLFGPIENYEGY